MCGRYLIDVNMLELFHWYNIPQENIEFNRGEIFPTNSVPIVIDDDGKKIVLSKWEYIIRGISRKVINARVETIAEKRSFRNSFYNRRCLIPASGFFEWKMEKGKKVKYRISVDDQRLFSMAGIYDTFVDDNNQPYKGFVVVTTEANKTMSEIHNRMPLILTKNGESQWINSEGNNLIDLDGLIKPLENERVKIIIERAEDTRKYEQLSFK